MGARPSPPVDFVYNKKYPSRIPGRRKVAPIPGENGTTWDDTFDWYYAASRATVESLKELSFMLTMAYGTVRNRHYAYVRTWKSRDPRRANRRPERIRRDSDKSTVERVSAGCKDNNASRNK